MMQAWSFIFILMSLNSCASLGVKPWERAILSKESMQISPLPLQDEFEDHTYFSKEASSGGRGFGGGGCGCN